MISRGKFGCLPSGRIIESFTIKNSYGEYVELLDYGATVYRLCVLDRNGDIGDVVLGAESAETFASGFNGSVIGRCANRIANGSYTIDGQTYQLECNFKGHFLHGASGNYAFRFFDAEVDEQSNSVIFSYTDEGDGGFDCWVDVKVIYTFGNDHRLRIRYEMVPDGTTILCPTNHTYFNLSGSGDVSRCTLQINSDFIAKKGSSGMPEGDIAPVGASGFDYRSPARIADRLNSLPSSGAVPRYDDVFLINPCGEAPAASLRSEEAGRIMNVYTDMPALVLFTPYEANFRTGKDGAIYSGYFSICLETQFVPNAVNCPRFWSPIFCKGEGLVSETIYEFLQC